MQVFSILNSVEGTSLTWECNPGPSMVAPALPAGVECLIKAGGMNTLKATDSGVRGGSFLSLCLLK